MDIIVTSTGKPFYGVDPLLGGILCEAFPEAIQRIAKPTLAVQQKNPAAPRFIARLHPLYGTPEIVRIALNQEQRFPGPGMVASVEGAQAAFGAAGHSIPADVLDKFAALLEIAKSNDPEVIADARARAQNAQYAREDQERGAQRRLQGE